MAATAPTALRSRIVGSGEEAPDQLVANPNNWRIHSHDQEQALAAVLEQVGWVQQVIVNRTTGHLVDGHLRVAHAISRSESTVPVVYVEITEDEEALILATLDPLGAMAGTDADKLTELLADLTVNDDALAAMLADIAPPTSTVGRTDPDDAPKLPARPKTKLGDLYEMGAHRLVCGDALDPAAFEAALGKGRAAMLWTDPPYGVAYQTKLSQDEAVARNRRRDGKEVTNDDITDEQLEQLLRESLMLSLERMKKGGAVYLAAPTGAPMLATFGSVLHSLGVWRQTLLWIKDVFVMGRHDYHYRHEAVLYGWKPGARHTFRGGRDQDSAWEIPRPKRSEDHPTMKPVELVARAIRNSSLPGDVVLDPFGGSGTTMIASEQEQRACAMIEIDPAYCDVIVRRWEEFTGGKAVRHRA
ncbi:MAG: DNA modification methylase [Actinomycetota bacterium]